MANDVYNHSASPDGLQRIGRIVVNSGGRGSNASKYYDPKNSKTIAINSIATKYDTRFDDPTYY